MYAINEQYIQILNKYFMYDDSVYIYYSFTLVFYIFI